MYLLICDKCGTALKNTDYYSIDVTKSSIGELTSGERTFHLCEKCYKNFFEKDMIK